MLKNRDELSYRTEISLTDKDCHEVSFNILKKILQKHSEINYSYKDGRIYVNGNQLQELANICKCENNGNGYTIKIVPARNGD
jgi:hypothetical protein